MQPSENIDQLNQKLKFMQVASQFTSIQTRSVKVRTTSVKGEIKYRKIIIIRKDRSDRI